MDGRFVRDHLGGLIRREADITDLVEPGWPFLLGLGVTDPSGSISTASAYAGHAIGGVLRSVSLMALPSLHLRSVHVGTDLAPSYDSARLRLDVEASFTGTELAEAELSVGLRDPGGEPVQTGLAPAVLSREQPSLQLIIPVVSPFLWSAETPELYRLSLELSSRSSAERVEQRVGVRTVAVAGNKLLVNARPITLRGVNRHDLHPQLGRCGDATFDWEDARVFKEASINFVRTSHYPPNPAFVEAADEARVVPRGGKRRLLGRHARPPGHSGRPCPGGRVPRAVCRHGRTQPQSPERHPVVPRQ